MLYYLFKIIITVILIVVISEVAKRSSFMGAILASVPLTSVMAISWLYVQTKDAEKVSNLTKSIFWLVLPSLALFLILPVLLKRGLNFYVSMSISIAVTVGCYWIMVISLNFFKIKL